MLLGARTAMWGGVSGGGGHQTLFSLNITNLSEGYNYLLPPSRVDMSAFSMSAWCKFKSLSSPHGSIIGIAENKSVSSSYGWTICSPRIYTSRSYGIVCDAVAWSSGFMNVPDTSWHHIAATNSGSSFVFYFDGERIATSTIGNPYPGGKYFLGGGRDNKTANLFVTRGCWWQRTLTDAEIASDFALGAASPNTDSLICYVPLDSETLVYDAISGGTFTLSNSTISTDTPWS